MHADLDPPDGYGRLLRELPSAGAPPYGYEEFERRAALRRRQAQHAAPGPRLAVAAVALVGVLAVLVRVSSPSLLLTPGAPAGAALAPTAPGPQDEDLPPGAGEGQRWLERLPHEPAVVRVGTRAAVMGLEDRIAQVDDLLSAARVSPDTVRLQALQQERVRLMGTLMQVRYAETLANATP